jgi:uncharacterized protein (DUF1499 family)
MPFPEGSKVWSKLVLVASVICVACAAVAIIGVRLGSFDFRVASDMLKSTLQAAIPVMIVAIIIFIGEAETRLKTGAAIVILLFPIVGIWMNQTPAPQKDEKGKRPIPLNDISTDTQSPPQYEAVISLRPEGSNSLSYPDNAANLQRARFPDIQSISSTLSTNDAFDKALNVVKESGWQLVFEDKSSGKIEAVASTFFFDFKDDVVIRVKGQGDASVIDIRSHSRVGRGDKGKNAERVRTFIEDFKQG